MDPPSKSNTRNKKSREKSPPPIPIEATRDMTSKERKTDTAQTAYMPPPMPEFVDDFKQKESTTKPPPIPKFATSTFSFSQIDKEDISTSTFPPTVVKTTTTSETNIYKDNSKTKEDVAGFRGNITEAIARVENIMKRLDNLQRIFKPSGTTNTNSNNTF